MNGSTRAKISLSNILKAKQSMETWRSILRFSSSLFGSEIAATKDRLHFCEMLILRCKQNEKELCNQSFIALPA